MQRAVLGAVLLRRLLYRGGHSSDIQALCGHPEGQGALLKGFLCQRFVCGIHQSQFLAVRAADHPTGKALGGGVRVCGQADQLSCFQGAGVCILGQGDVRTGNGKLVGLFRFGIGRVSLFDAERAACHKTALVQCAACGFDGIVVHARLNGSAVKHCAVRIIGVVLVGHGDFAVVLVAVVLHRYFLGLAVVGQVVRLRHGKVRDIQRGAPDIQHPIFVPQLRLRIVVCIGGHPDAQAVAPGLCGGTGAGADLVAVVVQHSIVAHDGSGVGSRLSSGIRIGNDLVLGDRIAVAQNERGIGALLIHISCIALSIADGSVADQNVEIRCLQLGLLDAKFVLLRGDIAARAAVGSRCHSGKGVIACIYGLLAAQQHAVRIVNCGKLLCIGDIGHGNIAIALSGRCTYCHTMLLAVIYGVCRHGKGKVCGFGFRFGVRLDVICDGECTICHRAALVPCAAFGDDGIVIFTRLNRRTMDHFAAAHLIEHGDLTVVLGAVVCHSHFLGFAVIGQVSGFCHGKVCGVQCSLLNGKFVILRGHIAARAGGGSCYSNGKGVSARLNGSTVQHLAVLLVGHGNSAVFLGGVFPNDHLHHLGVAVIGQVGGQGKGKVCGVCRRQLCRALVGGAQVEDTGLRNVILAQVDGAGVALSLGHRAVIGYAVHARDAVAGQG